MPYTMDTMPDSMKDKPEKIKKQWIAVWNSAYEKAIKDGKDKDEAEKIAFASANGVMKKAMKEALTEEEEDIVKEYNKEMTAEEWQDSYRKEGEAHWLDNKEHSPLADDLIKYIKTENIENPVILEIGIGSGVDSNYIASHNIKVIGIDVAESAVTRAKKIYKNNSNVTFKAGDAEKLDFKDDYFDAVYSVAAIHSTPLEDSLSEIHRVLKPGGIAKLFLYTKIKVGNNKWMSYWDENKIRSISESLKFAIKTFRTGRKIDKIDIPDVSEKINQESEFAIFTLKKKQNNTIKESEAAFLFKESHRIVESKDKEGKEWDVVLMQVGESKNIGSHGYKRYYSREAVQKAVEQGLFEKAPVTQYKFSADLADHVPIDIAESKPGGLFGNTVGWAKSVRFGEFIDENGQKQEGALATVYIDESEKDLRIKLMEMWQAGRMIGFSIDGNGSEWPRLMGSETVDYVSEISEILENTLVTYPAAGGHAIRLAASQTVNNGEIEMDLKEIIALIKANKPKLLEGKDETKLTESDALAMLKEAMQSEVVEKIIEKPVEKIVEKPVVDETIKKEVEKLQESIRISQKSVILTNRLTESNLPDPIKTNLQTRYTNKDFKEDELQADIKAEQDVWAKLQESKGLPGQARVQLGSDEKDKLGIAMDGFFSGQDEKDKDGKKVRRFISFKEAYANVVNDSSAAFASAGTILSDSYFYTPELVGDQPRLIESYDAKRRKAFRESRMREAYGMQTSDWAEILGNAINKKMQMEASNPDLQAWRDICSDISSFTNFLEQKRLQMGGYGVLSTVSERATYQPLTSPTDTQAVFTPAKKGGTDDLTMEMVGNDDVQAIRKIPVKLGRAAALTLHRDVFGMFLNNLEQDGSTTLATSARANYTTSVLSTAAYAEMRAAMRALTAYGDSYDILGSANVPAILLVPNELEDIALRVANSDIAISNIITAGTSHYNTQTEPNIWKGQIKKVIVVDYFTDATDWWGIADPAKAPTVEVSFYQGKQEPELFVQDLPNVGSMFNADKITYKVRYIYGFGILNYRHMALSHQ